MGRITDRVVYAAASVSQVGEGVDTAIRLGQMANSGARGVARGSVGLYQIGAMSRHRAVDRRGGGRAADDRGTRTGAAVVGGAVLGGSSLFHSDADRARVLDQIDKDVAQFRAEIEPQVNALVAPTARRQWWIVDVVPVLTEWADFRQREIRSWMTRFVTDWSVYASWLARVRALRSGARMQGIALVSPEPADLPETVIERGSAGRGGILETLWTFIKTIVYAAVGIVGVYSLYTVYRDVRGQKAIQG